MKLALAGLVLAVQTFAATPAELAGKWHVDYAGPKDTGPKTVGSMLLILEPSGDSVRGTIYVGVWPGKAPIADVKIDGDRITFTATGYLGSTTGIPTCEFVGIVNGDKMTLSFRTIRNGGGPLGEGVSFPYAGSKQSQ